MFTFSASVRSSSPCPWAVSRMSPVVMLLPYCILYLDVLQNMDLNMWLLAQAYERVDRSVWSSSRDSSWLFAWGKVWKVDKNVLYSIQEFQTWSNDFKRRGSAGSRPTYLSHFPSALENILTGISGGGGCPCFLCCRLQLCQNPAQEKPLVQSLSDSFNTHGGLFKTGARGKTEL